MKLCRTWREGDEGNLSKKLTPASPHVVKLGSSGTRPMNGTCAGGSSLAQSSSWMQATPGTKDQGQDDAYPHVFGHGLAATGGEDVRHLLTHDDRRL